MTTDFLRPEQLCSYPVTRNSSDEVAGKGVDVPEVGPLQRWEQAQQSRADADGALGTRQTAGAHKKEKVATC